MANIKIVTGCEGKSLYINDTRVSDSKPCGGGHDIVEFDIDDNELLSHLRINQEPVTNYGYIEEVYHRGKDPLWNVGTTLAQYEFYSDREGELVLGEITDVKLDETGEVWLYTFKDGGFAYENDLLSEEAYIKGADGRSNV